MNPARAAGADITELRQLVATCTACELCRGAKMGVPGEGPLPTEIMFIGEAPGFHEDQQGKPFIGAAGQFLNELLGKIGLDRGDVYITNVVKHRPPGNRDPLPDEMAACRPYLDRQIELVDPRMIVTLGRFSMARWFPGGRISQIHGQPKTVDGRIIVPMYHPAAALHQAALKATIEADFLKLPRYLADMRQLLQVEAAAEKPQPAQGRLF
ncbi:MAG TPA: uracil-DNA glycosylase [Thermomicrobiales bacterium]|jgi:DNA polymerase